MTLPEQPTWPAAVNVACCPKHGLHGMRTECFECDGPVEQVVFVDATVAATIAAERDRLRAENAKQRHALREIRDEMNGPCGSRAAAYAIAAAVLDETRRSESGEDPGHETT